ncbi:MAG: GNAT family N-acetyltransferase [Chloroflexi bacterium HGW-Chloroflexi-10]|nr:MAG: GNAT family N-acetyltransferase [Chloroflexi bacterium HGW-Chloroflexi-10]
MTIQIQQIESHQIAEAKRVILSVARNIFQWQAPLEEIILQFDEQGELKDIDELQSHYFDRQGIFLVAMDQGKIIGTGAIRKADSETAELKRLWLLEEYHGQGIGYQLMQMLLQFAQTAGYQHIHLLTDRRQDRAISFYQRLGFKPIQCDNNDPDDICMQLAI